MTLSPAPYHHNGYWWFWDEAKDEHGPYTSEFKACRAFDLYCKFLNSKEGPKLTDEEWEEVRELHQFASCYEVLSL